MSCRRRALRLEVSSKAIFIVIVLEETLNVGLQRGGYYPYLLKYYGSVTPSYIDVLEEASAQARG
jgi:hypothetical protein